MIRLVSNTRLACWVKIWFRDQFHDNLSKQLFNIGFDSPIAHVYINQPHTVYMYHTIHVFVEEDVSVIRALEDIHVKAMGHPVTFECELSHDVSEYAWLKNGRPVMSDRRHRLTQDGCVYRLHISHCEPEDVAEYTFSCRGKKSSAKLIPRSEHCSKYRHCRIEQINRAAYVTFVISV